MATRYKFDPATGKITLRKTKAPDRWRSYSSVASSQFQSEWAAPWTNAHSEFRGGLQTIRNQCRDLERSNSYAIRFLNEWTSGIVGTGFTFQSLAVNASGREDEGARAQIEEAFAEWKRARNCTASGDMPYNEFKALAERACARDGGVLIQKLRGYDNEFNFALNLLEIDRLDVDYNAKATRDGNRIIMGKEVDRYGKAVAYHLLGEHPGEVYSRSGRKRTRVPANQIIHRFYRKRPESVHGEPLMVGAITGLRHLEKYEEAEQIAARISASSTVAIERGVESQWEGDIYEDDQELTPGGKWELAPGEKVSLINPTHPNQNYDGFRGGVLKGVASGLLMSYPTLAQDYGGVTYSSLRESKLNIKALTQCYRALNIENEEEPIFRSWFSTALATGAIRLPASNFRNFAKASFTGRGFEWVDPLKDVAGLEKELQIGATSLSRAVKERLGVSLDVIIEERRRDAAAFEAAGLPVPQALSEVVELSEPQEADILEEEDE